MPGTDLLPRSRAGLSVLDAIIIAYCLLMAALTALRWSALPTPVLSLGIHLAVAVLMAIQAWATRRLPVAAMAVERIVLGAPLITFLFLNLGALVPFVNPWHGERLLHGIDNALCFGRNPNELLDRIAFPLLTEVLQIIYASYYLLPVVLLVALLVRRDVDRAARCMTAILLGFLLSYVGYFVIPATGPNLNLLGLYPWPPQAEEVTSGSSSLPGVLLAGPIRTALYQAETIRHDCFPSGHVAVSLVVLALARRHHRGVYRTLLAPVILLVVATVYLRYHYLVDVIAGAALTWLVLALAPRLDAAYARWMAAGAPLDGVSSGGG